ncbi:hypothetical protein LOD99_7764 [Oopsacas minuta]|uniref:Protein aurora borealis n=1 Tax=Oopsacas minuta TaxID=111878 RepID=A0AAV7JP08_9METZ|nr:hypothetical protein LOD99_7764 [Oopsacas minuta]
MSMMVDESQIKCDSPEEIHGFEDPNIPNWSPVCPEVDLGNPFHNQLKTSFPDFNSPSVFKVQSTPLTSSKPFKWSVEEIALLRPADIEECPNQEVVDNSYFVTPRRAEASTKFFSGIHSIPSLMSPCTSSRPCGKTNSTQMVNTDVTPNPYSFSRPPEMMEAELSPTPIRAKSPILEESSPSPPPTLLTDEDRSNSLSLKPRDSILPKISLPPHSFPSAPVNTPINVVSPATASTTQSVNVGVQTMLTLPLDFDLERVLGRHAYYQGEDMANNSTLRRILFRPSISDPKQDLPLLQESLPSPITNSNILTSHKISEDTSYRSDIHETPKTSKILSKSYSKSFIKSRSIKRCPVSSYDITASTPGTFLMSLISGKLECSNLPTPISSAPFVSPIHSVADPNLSLNESDRMSEESTPPRNSSLCEDYSFPLKQDPTPMSPITYKSYFQRADTSPNPYKATSTPFLHPEHITPPSRKLSFLSPAALLSGEESPSRDIVTSDYPTQCHEEDVMQEDPAPPTSPPTFSDLFQIPDKIQVTHSLESDSGIGSSYGEQSSLLQSLSRHRAKPAEHQLSLSYCPDKQLTTKSMYQTPGNNCSIANGNVSKLRSKRGCVKVDSSPLSIVHHALPTFVHESKRYQPECAIDSLTDSATSSSSKDTESDPCDPLLANPSLVQQQVKHIETIEKLKNYSKWTAHKKNIEFRTNHQN